jgi:orotidine-5'-phosphate decarboxylase
MTLGRKQLIVALDVPSVAEARELIAKLGDGVGVYKIGLELLFAGGFALAQELAAAGRSVFVDAEFLTVHALDRKTLDAAVRGRGDSALKLLGVTVLTNLAPSDLNEQGIDHPLHELVLHRALLAKHAGFDGVVASGHEAAAIRKAAGPGFLIVTPGVRQQGSATQDQARAVTPAKAIEAGADYLVVGRPITRAPDPHAAAEAIAAEIASVLSR